MKEILEAFGQMFTFLLFAVFALFGTVVGMVVWYFCCGA